MRGYRGGDVASWLMENVNEWEEALILLRELVGRRLQRLPDGSGLLEVEPELFERIEEIVWRADQDIEP